MEVLVPIFKHHTSFQLARGIKAFLILYAGFHRDAIMDPEQELQLTQQQLADRNRTIANLRRQLEEVAPGRQTATPSGATGDPLKANDRPSKGLSTALY